MDYCKYVNVFQGSGEIDLPKPEGIAAKWFFIKAGCGNTSPAACVPFSAMSVSPYSGGYPTGYGDHCPNSHSRPPHFAEGKDHLIGFAHLQQSGTGAIGFYYNYALTVPAFDGSPVYRKICDEAAVPGYYTCTLDGIMCELTSTLKTAVHRYSFPKGGGKVTVDFLNNGLTIPGNEKKGAELESICSNGVTVTAAAAIEGIKLYFAAEGCGKVQLSGGKAVFTGFGNVFTMKLSISLESEKAALDNISRTPDFETVKENAYNEWNKALSVIDINCESEKIREIFYSNLYHSFIKPADWSGESFIYGSGKPFTVDLATLWDMYKTALPLIFMTQKDIGEKIVETLLLLGENLGAMPNRIGLSDDYKQPDEQARMLGSYALLTAFCFGVKVDPKRMLDAIMTDVFADNKKDFTVDGKCASHTWMLDMADACALAAELAKEIGNDEAAEKLAPLAAQWRSVYSAETGLLNSDSQYYEGTLYNYSFRQMVSMDERIELAGGKERFTALLDRFFGYGAPDTVQPTDPHNYKPVEEGIKLGRFEGFNNESDTEAPFSYVYAGRHDRTCEIIRAGLKYMFTTGRGGIPGNNDSGALSSYYVLNALGIFPVAGQDLFIFGSPIVNSACVKLFNGAELNIKVNNNSDENIYVDSVLFNGKECSSFMIQASELMNGGTLEFNMINRKGE